MLPPSRSPSPGGHHDDAYVTRQAPAPAARRDRAPPDDAPGTWTVLREEPNTRWKPSRTASAMRRSMAPLGRISPPRPISPRKMTSAGAGPVIQAGKERRGDGEIRSRLGEPDARGDLHEDVEIGERGLGPPLQHGQQHGEPPRIETGGHPLWRAVARLGRERLDLHQHRPSSFHQRGDRAAADALGPRRQEHRGRIRHRHQASLGHGEHAELVHRAETVLGGAEQPVVQRGLTLEVEHRVHDVLQRLGPGDAAALGDMAHHDDRGSALLGKAHQLAGALAHLAHVAGRALQHVGVDRLDGVDDHHVGVHRG